ncbi:protein phosphatase 2C domain-containing protein [Streptomyces sp. NPDC005408]|uniref:PP2C family protein-serine/threonine phosphatase n=1 Tax=Streptomyces sp. NPDC005408 TaxID=3155341 RepID=UPI0033AE3B0E
MPVRWSAATVTDQGPRRCMADAAHVHYYRPADRHGWAVADGIGDDYEPADAARTAAAVAAHVASISGAAAGIAAARAELQDLYAGAPRGQEGDCVMVAAVPMAERVGGGFDIAWVGDCRAYVAQNGTVRQVTEDHTQGEEMRRSGNAWTRELAPGYDHIVTRSVLRVSPIASVRIAGPVQRLLLCSDGVSKVLPAADVVRILTTSATAPRIARALLSATRAHLRARDNVALTVLTPRNRTHGPAENPAARI